MRSLHHLVQQGKVLYLVRYPSLIQSAILIDWLARVSPIRPLGWSLRLINTLATMP